MLMKIIVTKRYRTTNPSGVFCQTTEGFCNSQKLVENINTFLPPSLNFINAERKMKITENDIPEINRILHFKAEGSRTLINQFHENLNMRPKQYIEYYKIKVEKKGE